MLQMWGHFILSADRISSPGMHRLGIFHPCRQNHLARDASPRDFSSLQTESSRQGCIDPGFFIPPDRISSSGMHRPGIFHPCGQNLLVRDASPLDFSSLQTEALEKYYFISWIYAEAEPYFFAFPSNSSMYLSKSDINNLSCITRYFSNSVSAWSLAISAVTLPASCKIP